MDRKNILRTAFRQSGKRRGYALLNIAGLAVGMASCLLPLNAAMIASTRRLNVL